MYRLEIMPKAEAGFARLDATIEQRILDKLRSLCENCDTHRHEALRGAHRGKFCLPSYLYLQSTNTSDCCSRNWTSEQRLLA